MNEDEATKLVRFVRALTPNQAMDEYTPLAWHMVLGEISFDAAIAAVKSIIQRERYISATDIIQQVKRDRRNLTDAADDSFRLQGDPDDSVAYIEQIRRHRRAIGDGWTPPALPAGRKPVPQLDGVFRHVSEDERPSLRLINSETAPREIEQNRTAIAEAREQLAKRKRYEHHQPPAVPESVRG